MTISLEIREALPDDATQIETLYHDAFPEEDLVPLVKELLQLKQGILSLVAEQESNIVGHIAFTHCSIENKQNVESNAALLGPLAVSPGNQKQGTGTSLIKHGFEKLNNADISHIFVLGDPAYYSRSGFKPEVKVKPPYPLPDQWAGAWQSIHLDEETPSLEGILAVPKPWLNPALWSE